jgi:hypothetical protein
MLKFPEAGAVVLVKIYGVVRGGRTDRCLQGLDGIIWRIKLFGASKICVQ